MKFGIFNELQLPRPWTSAASTPCSTRHSTRSLADRLGYDNAWEVEHHFLEGFTTGPVSPGSVTLWDEYQEWKETPAGRKARRARGLIGTPQQLRSKLRKFEQSHIDQVILLNQAGKNRHDDICAPLALFARAVMPEIKERDHLQQVWKQGVWTGEIELEEIDVAAYTFATSQTPKDKRSQFGVDAKAVAESSVR